MAKNDSSKTILIIVGVILGIMIIGGIVVGISCYSLYKVGTKTSPTPTATNETKNWLSYKNVRYGFSLKYPPTFTAQESINGDGTTLTSSSPAITVRVYGTVNSQNQTLDDYLNTSRADLFKGVESAEEAAANDTTLAGISAQERRWQYLNSLDGTQTVMDQVTALKGDSFYTVQMVIAYSDYSEYSPMFDEILKSYKFE